MKPEPLKAKVIHQDTFTRTHIQENQDIFFKEDIKSAIEWLKDRIMKDIEYLKKYNRYNAIMALEAINAHIDKAFEDVIEIEDFERACGMMKK